MKVRFVAARMPTWQVNAYAEGASGEFAGIGVAMGDKRLSGLVMRCRSGQLVGDMERVVATARPKYCTC